MNDSGPLQRGRENITGIVALLITGTWLAAMLLNVEWWLPFMLFGYIVVVPVTAILFGDEADRAEWWLDSESTSVGESQEQETDPAETGDALENLRDRYARGELSDEQFERKLERLLETETVEDAAEHLRERDRPSRNSGTEREFETNR